MSVVKGSLLFLGVLLLPIYTYDSGAMQPSHLVLFAFAIITLTSQGFPATAWVARMLAFTLYVGAVESSYVVMGGDPTFLLSPMFYFYNLLIAGAVYIHVRESGIRVFSPGVLAATSIALGTVMISGVALDGSSRVSGAFNNPNQLGFFSVCLLSITYLLYLGRTFTYWVAATVFSASLFLAVASLSKAAMIANMVVILLALKPARSRNAIIGWSLVGIFGLAVLYHQYRQRAFEELEFIRRLENMTQENDSSLESRGYFTFLEGNMCEMLCGLGSQKVLELNGHEVHSTFGSVLNNYGLIGLVLFGSIIVLWVESLWRAFGVVGVFCLSAPAMLYGVTHNGTRFTFFWVVFAATLGLADQSLHVDSSNRNRKRLTEMCFVARKSWSARMPIPRPGSR